MIIKLILIVVHAILKNIIEFSKTILTAKLVECRSIFLEPTASNSKTLGPAVAGELVPTRQLVELNLHCLTY